MPACAKTVCRWWALLRGLTVPAYLPAFKYQVTAVWPGGTHAYFGQQGETACISAFPHTTTYNTNSDLHVSNVQGITPLIGNFQELEPQLLASTATAMSSPKEEQRLVLCSWRSCGAGRRLLQIATYHRYVMAKNFAEYRTLAARVMKLCTFPTIATDNALHSLHVHAEVEILVLRACKVKGCCSAPACRHGLMPTTSTCHENGLTLAHSCSQ